MKHLSTKFLVLTLLIVAFLSGYNYFKRPFLNRFEKLEQQLETLEIIPTPDPLQVALDELTVREKILQMVSQPIVLEKAEATIAAELAWSQDNRPGFITLFGSNLAAEEVTGLIAKTRFPDGYLPLIAVDHEGGTVQRLNGTAFSRLPSWRQSCQLSSSERKELFIQSADELSQTGVQIVFAPVLDVARTGSFLGGRACVAEDEVVAAATDYITSFAQYGILPVVKHFPGIGSAESDLHYQLDTVELEAQDTVVFDRVLGSFPNVGVMTTHVVVADRTDGMPCSLSAVCLDQLLSHFPESLLFTDALEMRSASLEEGSSELKTLPEVAVLAISAGNDVLVFGETIDEADLEVVIAVLEESYADNENFRRRVDASVAKILKFKLPQAGIGEK